MKRWILIVVVLVLVASAGTVVAAPAVDDDLPPVTEDEQAGERAGCESGAPIHPGVERLARRYGVPYKKVLDAFCGGYGLGEIALALRLNNCLNNGGLNNGKAWQTLLEMRQQGVGWGQVMLAVVTAKAVGDEDVTPDSLLRQRADGMEWGKIWQGLGLIGNGRGHKPASVTDEGSAQQGHPPRGNAGRAHGRGQGQGLGLKDQ